MIRTFIDSGVLIAAVRGKEEVAIRAIEVLDDPERVFVSSDFVRLEVLPKAKYNRREEEAKSYEAFFRAAQEMVRASRTLINQAYNEASRAGLAAMDALHVAAAKVSGSDEFLTTEKPAKPIFRAEGIKVKTIRPPAGRAS